MNNGKMRASAFAFVQILLITATAFTTNCGSNKSSSNTSLASAPISGNWQMTLQSSDVNEKPKTQSGFLQETGGVVTGSMIFDDSANACSGVGDATGTVSGSTVSLSVNPVGIQISLDGTLTSTSMNGSYTMLSTGCSGRYSAPETGKWTANIVTPLNGNMQGTFTSLRLGSALPITGKVTQGPNTGTSNAILSGSLSITGYCFTSASISGAVSGTSVVMNLLNSDGTQIGQVSGTSTVDGKSMTGTYNIVPLGPGGTQPCQNGDSGSVTLTL